MPAHLTHLGVVQALVARKPSCVCKCGASPEKHNCSTVSGRTRRTWTASCTPGIWVSRSEAAGGSASHTGSQVTLVLPALGTHFENQWPRGQRDPSSSFMILMQKEK